MRTKAKSTRAKPSAKVAPRPLADEVKAALTWLERHASKRTRDEMEPRYGIRTDKAFGVSVADMRTLAKQLGRNHELAGALWDTGWYEARMLASMVDDAERVTPAQMDRWCRDFDNWGICDTVCFCLFDRSPHAFAKVVSWSKRRDEFQKRAAFALLACLALHGRAADNAAYIRCLPLIEKAADDERNFVKKGVNWALRAIGGRNPQLNAAAVAVAQRLAASAQPAARWIGKDALRQLARPAAARRIAAGGRAKR
jgi:3-methyladenine DNA glycosylase AlkD